MATVTGITIGDYNGIGPEIIIKSMIDADLTASTPLIISPEAVIRFYADKLDTDISYNLCKSTNDIRSGWVNLLHLDVGEVDITPGLQTKESGSVAMRSIQKAINLTLQGTTHSMVTAPISKEAVNLAGYFIPGHTEFLAEKTHADSVLMMLVNEGLRVALTTVHIPVSKIASEISKEGIKEKLSVLYYSLKHDFQIDSPRIAVLGLNPHAGDGGVIGTEEIDIIGPAITESVQQGIPAVGPYPADGFFGQKHHTQFDAVLAMYHDQGLAPFKLLSFGSGVNFTAGLPIIRTSPDHGTAFDIAGKGVADASSFNQAYKLAVTLSKKKHG